jgi:hypothetical protein
MLAVHPQRASKSQNKPEFLHYTRPPSPNIYIHKSLWSRLHKEKEKNPLSSLRIPAMGMKLPTALIN